MNATLTAKKTAWIPSGYTEVQENAFGAVYITRSPKLAAIAYRKDARGVLVSKAAWHFSFGNTDRLESRVSEFLKSVIEANAWKQEQKAARREAQQKAAQALEVGQIYACSWGYDQTNVDFYQVIGKKGAATAILRQIKGEHVEPFGPMCSRIVGVKDSFIEDQKPLEKRVTDYGFKMTSYSWATLWDGKSMYCSWYA